MQARYATLAILVATLFWGITFVLIKEAVATLHPYNFLFWRFAVASAILAVVAIRRLPQIRRTTLRDGTILGLLLAGTVTFQTIGLQYTAASKASFITGTSVVFVPIFVAMMLRRLPGRTVVLAVVATLLGLALITLTDSLDVNRGDGWVILCALCFAGYIILAERYSRRHDTIPLTLVQIVAITLISAVLNSFQGNFRIPSGYIVWQAILFCAIFASVIAFLLQLRFQKYLSATKTAIIFAAEPIFATIAAVAYLGEELNARFVVGAILIFGSMLLVDLQPE